MKSSPATKCILILTAMFLLTALPVYSQTKAKPAARPKTKTVQIGLNAPGELLIFNHAGKRIGYDSTTNKEINEIAGATVFGDSSLTYVVPIGKTLRPFKIQISGESLTEKTETDLAMTGSGFVIRFDNIQLDRGEKLIAAMRPDGRELSYTAGADGETPAFSFAVDPPSAKQASYLFRLSRSNLSPGKTITATLDLIAGKFYFGDDDGQEARYDLKMTRINPNGAEDVLTRDKISFGKTNRYLLDFGKWNGKDAACFYAEDKNKGFVDKNCVK